MAGSFCMRRIAAGSTTGYLNRYPGSEWYLYHTDSRRWDTGAPPYGLWKSSPAALFCIINQWVSV